MLWLRLTSRRSLPFKPQARSPLSLKMPKKRLSLKKRVSRLRIFSRRTRTKNGIVPIHFLSHQNSLFPEQLDGGFSEIPHRGFERDRTSRLAKLVSRDGRCR